MRHLLIVACLLTYSTAFGQEFRLPYQDERKAYMEIGLGLTGTEAGVPYKVKPDFLKNIRLSGQVFLAPQFIVAERINVGLRLGGVFRPRYQSTDSSASTLFQDKFTPYALPFVDVYLGGNDYRNARFFFGAGVGATLVGKLETRNLLTRDTFFTRLQDRDIFLTVMPHIGVTFSDLKIQAEYLMTFPQATALPAVYSLTLSNTFPMGRRRLF